MDFQKIALMQIIESYSNQNELINWIKQLRYFAFYKGGLSPFATDGDKFELHLRFTSNDELSYLLLELNLNPAYSKNPGIYIIDGVNCYLEVKNNFIIISPFEKNKVDWDKVDKREFLNCQRLELYIDSKGITSNVTFDYQDTSAYINYQKYPELQDDSLRKNIFKKQTLTIPFISEGIKEIKVFKIMINVGDSVKVGQPLIEVESDNAFFEITSKFDGVVIDVKLKENEVVKIHDTVCIIEMSPISSSINNIQSETNKLQSELIYFYELLSLKHKIAKELGMELESDSEEIIAEIKRLKAK